MRRLERGMGSVAKMSGTPDPTLLPKITWTIDS